MSESVPHPLREELHALEEESDTIQQENDSEEEESDTIQQENDSEEEESDTEEEELVYTNEGFEKFLQQAELAGISREQQDELITMFLADEVPLGAVILDTLSRTFTFVRRYKLRLLVPLVIFGLLGFVFVNEYRARKGVQDYQPWQFELSAQLRHWQIKYLSWFDWNFIFEEDCFIPNPYFLLTRKKEERDDIDCVNMPRELTVASTSIYSGIFNNKKFPLPLVLTEAQNDWKLGENSTLEDLHKVLLSHHENSYPCVRYLQDVGVKPEFTLDPVGALIEGKLTDSGGSSLSLLFLDGCSKQSNKILRGLTLRPIFLGPDIESLRAIKGIVAKNIPNNSTVKIEVKPLEPGDGSSSDGYLWLAQVLGTSTITLRDLDCLENKPSVYKMHPGDIGISFCSLSTTQLGVSRGRKVGSWLLQIRFGLGN